MSLPILATKLYIPPTRENALPRPHLIDKLLAGARRPGCFSLISGPAGFGKTTLISEFVARLPNSAAWLSLDEGDNDPVRFWHYFITACQTIQPGVGQAALKMISAPQALVAGAVPTALINDLSAQDQPLILVLDDYHTIQNLVIHNSLLFLLDHLPPNLHLVVSTRIDPPWPLARFRARNHLTEIRARDLRFSRAESAQFLHTVMGLDLAPAQVTALAEQTEGWAAGLQLAGLSLQRQEDVAAFVKTFRGSHRYIAEYLIEEVLQRQTETQRTFLLQTSILKRMNAGVCEAVSGHPDGQALLQALYTANIFLVSLDHEGTWFRYHHLFSDLLQARLQENYSRAKIAELHRRASAWFAQNDDAVEAIHHALAARDIENAARLVEQAARSLIFTGQLKVLQNWLGALPPACFQAYPRLDFYQFWIDVLQNQADLSDAALQEKEDLLDALPASPENDRLRGELMAVVCRAIVFTGRTTAGIRLAQKALSYLSPNDPASRARANSAIAAGHDMEGRAEPAAAAYRTSKSQALTAGDYRLAAHTLMIQGLVQCEYGLLQQACATFQSIVDLNPQTMVNRSANAHADDLFFPAGQGYIGLGSVHLEWNDLETAERELVRGRELCQVGGLDGVFMARVQMARLRQAAGDFEQALEEIQLAEKAAPRIDDFTLIARRVQIHLAQGDHAGAWQLAAPFAEPLAQARAALPMPLIFLEILEALSARVYLAQGEIEKALQLLARLKSSAAPARRVGRLLDYYLLRAQAFPPQSHGGPAPEAVACVLKALAFGEPEGYFLLFLEAGPQLHPLLEAATKRSEAPERLKQYAHRLLDAILGTRGQQVAAPDVAAGLIEPLTPRELEVLGLLASGASNRVIAAELFITVRTVKKHNSNIYGKLGVASRLQAVARARTLGLLAGD